MIINKRFVLVMVIFVLGTVLLTGCGGGAGGETGLEEEPGVTDPAVSPNGEEPGVTDPAVPPNEEETGESQATATASGTLKTISTNDGTVTIATESGDELVLKVTSESKILISESLLPIAQLDTVIGSKVSAEYHTETKTATVINIQD
ncbi:MAG: hypothetical protein AAGU27_09775 [Dehalobacterium sp.]